MTLGGKGGGTGKHDGIRGSERNGIAMSQGLHGPSDNRQPDDLDTSRFGPCRLLPLARLPPLDSGLLESGPGGKEDGAIAHSDTNVLNET